MLMTRRSAVLLSLLHNAVATGLSTNTHAVSDGNVGTDGDSYRRYRLAEMHPGPIQTGEADKLQQTEPLREASNLRVANFCFSLRNLSATGHSNA